AAMASTEDGPVLYGGRLGTGETVRDTWQWSGLAWVPLGVTGNAPPSRSDHGLSVGPLPGRMVVLGGLGPNSESLQDLWEWSGASWAELTLADGAPSPGPRSGHQLA